MIVGFTGTQQDLPPAQSRGLGLLLTALKSTHTVTEAHHGDCIGGDAVFDSLCAALGIPRHAHPAPDGPKRAHCDADVIYPELPPLTRNRDIARVCDLLVACPRTVIEQRRSGTWATVRQARKAGREIWFVWPDGVTATEPARVALL